MAAALRKPNRAPAWMVGGINRARKPGCPGPVLAHFWSIYLLPYTRIDATPCPLYFLPQADLYITAQAATIPASGKSVSTISTDPGFGKARPALPWPEATRRSSSHPMRGQADPEIRK